MRVMIKGISSMATRAFLQELAAAYAHRTGVGVTFESIGGVDAVKRVQAGEPFDIVVLAADAIRGLCDAGYLVAANCVDVARSGIAVGVREGAPAPDIGSEAAVRRAVLSAHSIGYSTGPSGTQLIRLFEHWGIADAIRDKLVQSPPGVPVGTLLARGEVELGFQQLSELMHVEHIQLVGSLPADTQIYTTFAAGICAASKQADAAYALLEFMTSPVAAAAIRRHGMDPAAAAG